MIGRAVHRQNGVDRYLTTPLSRTGRILLAIAFLIQHKGTINLYR
jgi:hypothetical protein